MRWAIYTVDPMLFPSGNPFECHEEVLYLQPLIPPKRFDISPPDWGMLRRSRYEVGDGTASRAAGVRLKKCVVRVFVVS